MIEIHRARRRTGGVVLRVALALSATACVGQAQLTVRRNLGAVLSEEEGTAAALERSLNDFLTEARNGRFPTELVDPVQLARFGFFYEGLSGAGAGPDFDAPTVLRSYTLDGHAYVVTVAFTGVRDGAPFLHKVIEFEATPFQDGYRFSSRFEAETQAFQVHRIGGVTFHSRGSLDLEKANRFSRFREQLGELTGTPPAPLDYYCFESLGDLLRSYGFVFDSTKCNFLGRDLGFADDEGRRYVTGTGREDYIFGYVGPFLAQRLPDGGEMYGPFVNGMAAYYGGYSLSADTLGDLKRQFRETLEADPDVDFLAEFQKGRASSVQRHFSFYVMCAFLCEEAIARHGFEGALRLAYSGSGEGPFFEELEELLGVNESNFHATIVRLIATESNQ